MTRWSSVLLLSLTLATVPCPPAFAEVYLAVFGGGAFSADTEMTLGGSVIVDAFPFSMAGTFEEASPDTSGVFGAKLGVWFDEKTIPGPRPFGLEIEVLHYDPDLAPPPGEVSAQGMPVTATADLDLSVTNIAINALYRVPKVLASEAFPQGRLQPYLGVGLALGVGKVDGSLSSPGLTIADEDSEADLGIQVQGGLRYVVSKRVAIFVEYKFLHHGFAFHIDSATTEITLNSHLTLGGVAFHLP